MIKLQRFARAASIATPLWILVSPVEAGNVIETMHEVSDSGQFEIDEFAAAFEAAGLANELEGAGGHYPDEQEHQRRIVEADRSVENLEGELNRIEDLLESARQHRADVERAAAAAMTSSR